MRHLCLVCNFNANLKYYHMIFNVKAVGNIEFMRRYMKKAILAEFLVQFRLA